MGERLAKQLYEDNFLVRLQKVQDDVSLLQKLYVTAVDTTVELPVGWTEVISSWTYAGPNTINIPSGGASIYKKGMGLRIKQGGAYKFYYITIAADALLTVTGGTDYTVANAAITDIAITTTPHTAVGFPVTFNLAAPTWNTSTIDNGTGGQQPTAGSQSFRVDGDEIELMIALGSSGVLKNNAGTTISISAIPSTLPNIIGVVAEAIGYGMFASIGAFIAICYFVSATSFDVAAVASIANNASIAYSSFKIRYKY